MKAAGIVPAAFFVHTPLPELFLMSKNRKIHLTKFWRERGARSKK
jgi:hypothetical protein